MDIHVTWAIIIGFAILMYAIFDGFDLGTGILLFFVRNEVERDMIVDTITPVWDGNETWIVLAGVGLFGGFPLAYGTILPALYLPFIVMVLSLAFRALSMEFRFLAGKGKHRWDLVFSIGSLLAGFCQGLILANLIDGVVSRTMASAMNMQPLYFFTPFACSTGLLVVLLYLLMASNWLNLKTSGRIQDRVKKASRILGVIVLIIMAFLIFSRKMISAFAPRFNYNGFLAHHETISLILYGISAIALLLIVLRIRGRNDKLPFLLNILLFVCLGAEVIGHLWPFIVPPYVTLFSAGSPEYGNSVLLYSALVVVPIIILYITFSYFVFKGKAKRKEQYEPVLADDLKALHRKGKETNERNSKITNLRWPVRILLSLTWLILFFIVLGFLGDFAALGIIFVLNVVFLFFWYKQSRQNQYPNES